MFPILFQCVQLFSNMLQMFPTCSRVFNFNVQRFNRCCICLMFPIRFQNVSNCSGMFPDKLRCAHLSCRHWRCHPPPVSRNHGKTASFSVHTELLRIMAPCSHRDATGNPWKRCKQRHAGCDAMRLPELRDRSDLSRWSFSFPMCSYVGLAMDGGKRRHGPRSCLHTRWG